MGTQHFVLLPFLASVTCEFLLIDSRVAYTKSEKKFGPFSATDGETDFPVSESHGR